MLLAIHIALDILAATPVMGWIAGNPAVNWGLTWPIRGMDLLLLFALWRGSRAAFRTVGEAQPPRDWLREGFLCYLLALATALWSELVPAVEPSWLGVTITNHWLYYLRPIAFLILEIRLLVCIAHQSDALAGLGYDIAPAPVRVSARPFLLGVFALTLAASPPARRSRRPS